jgi:hypothetical protein
MRWSISCPTARWESCGLPARSYRMLPVWGNHQATRPCSTRQFYSHQSAVLEASQFHNGTSAWPLVLVSSDFEDSTASSASNGSGERYCTTSSSAPALSRNRSSRFLQEFEDRIRTKGQIRREMVGIQFEFALASASARMLTRSADLCSVKRRTRTGFFCWRRRTERGDILLPTSALALVPSRCRLVAAVRLPRSPRTCRRLYCPNAFSLLPECSTDGFLVAWYLPIGCVSDGASCTVV